MTLTWKICHLENHLAHKTEIHISVGVSIEIEQTHCMRERNETLRELIFVMLRIKISINCMNYGMKKTTLDVKLYVNTDNWESVVPVSLCRFIAGLNWKETKPLAQRDEIYSNEKWRNNQIWDFLCQGTAMMREKK